MTCHRTNLIHAPQHRARWHPSVLIFLAAGMLILDMPDAASASCGDYVLVNGKPLSALRHESAGRPSLPELPLESDALPQRPCNGPHCGKQLPLPVPAQPSAPTQTTGDRWGLALAVTPAADLHWAALLLESPLSISDWQPVADRAPAATGRLLSTGEETWVARIVAGTIHVPVSARGEAVAFSGAPRWSPGFSLSFASSARSLATSVTTVRRIFPVS